MGTEHKCEKFPGREQNCVMVVGCEQKGMFACKKSMGLRLQVVEAVWCISLHIEHLLRVDNRVRCGKVTWCQCCGFRDGVS